MSSVHKQEGKPNWFCAFYDPEGFRRFKSTGTDNRRIAETVCSTIERAARLANQGKLSNEKALRLCRDAKQSIEETHGAIVANRAHETIKAACEEFIRSAGGELTAYTVRSWFDSWLAGRTDASKATVTEYRRVLDQFFVHLGARADRALSTLQQAQVEAFKARLIERVSPSTVNKALKVLKASLGAAVRARQLDFSPAEHVPPVDGEETGRRPFTDEEIVALLKAADPEWRTMILVGFYTGQRLRDCASLTWEHVDLLHASIGLTTEKTSRRQVIPIAVPLQKHLQSIAGDDPRAPLCPGLRGKSSSVLSNRFYQVMVKAGLAEKRDHDSKGKGRDGRRDTSKVSFHSLRYSTTSSLKNAGVSESVAMDIVGHDTAAVSRNYTKIADEAKRAAIAKLPDITQ
jgi:integrase